MKFSEWFESQHGKPPSKMEQWEILDRLAAAQYEAARLQALYMAVSEYNARRTSALYSWQLSDKDKEGAMP